MDNIATTPLPPLRANGQQAPSHDVDTIVPTEPPSDAIPDDALEDDAKAHEPVVFGQHTLLSYLISNIEIWNAVAPILKEEFFDKQYRPVYRMIVKHFVDYDALPTPTMIRMQTGELFELQPEPTDASDPRTVRWVLDQFERFSKHAASYRLFLDAAAKFGTNQMNDQQLSLMQTRMEQIVVMSVQPQPGVEVHRDGLRIISDDEFESQFPTGYRHLDLVTGGGMPSPGMVIWAAKSGIGKSVLLQNCALNAADRGVDVVYISMELGERKLAQRFVAMATDTGVREIKQNLSQVGSILEDRVTCGSGNIYIKYLTLGSTIVDVKAYYENLLKVEKCKPKMLCLDYLDILSPRQLVKADNIHLRDKYTSEEVYAFCVANHLICFTASQLVKGSEELESYTQDTVAGGTPKISICDYLGLLKREYDEELLIVKLVKARDGGHESRIPLHWDTKTLRITDGPDERFFKDNPFWDPHFRDRRKRAEAGLNTRAKEIFDDLKSREKGKANAPVF